MEEDVKKKLRDLFDDMLTKVGEFFRRKSPVYAKRQKKTGVKNWWKN